MGGRPRGPSTWRAARPTCGRAIPPTPARSRDGQIDPAYRTNDIFFDTIDLARVGIPHADVQMRLLTRVIADLLADAHPVPRLWYFPGAQRTVMVLTGDSHTSAPGPYDALLGAVEAAGGRLSLYFSRYIDGAGLPLTTWVANGPRVGPAPVLHARRPDDSRRLRPGRRLVDRPERHSPAVWRHGAAPQPRVVGLGRPGVDHGRLRHPPGYVVLQLGAGDRQPDAGVAGARLHHRQRPADALRERERPVAAGLPAGHRAHRRAADHRHARRGPDAGPGHRRLSSADRRQPGGRILRDRHAVPRRLLPLRGSAAVGGRHAGLRQGPRPADVDGRAVAAVRGGARGHAVRQHDVDRGHAAARARRHGAGRRRAAVGARAGHLCRPAGGGHHPRRRARRAGVPGRERAGERVRERGAVAGRRGAPPRGALRRSGVAARHHHR